MADGVVVLADRGAPTTVTKSSPSPVVLVRSLLRGAGKWPVLVSVARDLVSSIPLPRHPTRAVL